MARVPLYRKAETEMLRRIRTGQWTPGQRLGNEFELAAEFGVSQGTMRRALMMLESMGHLARKPGRGTVVVDPARDGAAGSAPGSAAGSTAGSTPGPGFDRLAMPDGHPPALTVFRAKTSTRRAGQAEAALFGTERLIVVERFLTLGSERVALDEIALPETLLPKVDPEAGTDLPGFLAAHGLAAALIEDRVTAEICTMGQSVALKVDRNTALLRLRRIARAQRGEVQALQTVLLATADIGYDIPLTG